jgi:Mycothiol maleylpyruvate isomerase N-terminal domain
MSSMSDVVGLAVDEMRAALTPASDLTWDVPAGDVEWTCRATAGHVADDLFSYASQVIAQPDCGYLPIEAVMEPRASNAEILRVVAMCGRLLSNAVDSASSDARAWHPHGTSDPEGFAAMGVVEVLVHTYDIAEGLELGWRPPSTLCAPVLQRLFPGAPEGDASHVLLHLTGRQALAGRERLTDWAWDSSVRTGSAARRH